MGDAVDHVTRATDFTGFTGFTVLGFLPKRAEIDDHQTEQNRDEGTKKRKSEKTN